MAHFYVSAEQIAQRLAGEDGVEMACDLLEELERSKAGSA